MATVPWWDEAKKSLADDPHLGPIIARYDDVPLQNISTLFETLARSIVGQQVSVASADAVWGRLMNLIGSPKAERIRTASDEALRATGLSRSKVSYLRALCDARDELEGVDWGAMSDDAIMKHLARIRGIGPWTAEMAMIFALGRPDVLPLGDIGLIRAVERIEGRSMDRAEVAAFAGSWRPWRTAATWYLWRTIDAEPVQY